MNSSFEAVGLVRKEFETASDRAAAIVGAAFLEELLVELLRDFFVDDRSSDKSIFKGYGFLSSFSSKIDLAYRLGLLSKSEHQRLHAIRSIRNEFAHNLSKISFFDPDIQIKCEKIETAVALIIPESIPVSIKGEKPPLPIINKLDKNKPREIFEQCTLQLMHLFAARYAQAVDSKRSYLKEFLLAHEPGEVVLTKLKKQAFELNSLKKETEKLLRTDSEKQNSKIEKLMRIQEFCIEQIKAAHAQRLLEE